ncbi:MAG: hypothetical protein DDT19_01821 [Syntrophomonadaceae bacterium]|nr:hypothetical protein [Bacillota bacterium]
MLTITRQTAAAQRISRDLAIVTGIIAFGPSYPAGGEDVSAITRLFKDCYGIICNPVAGFLFEFDDRTSRLRVRHTSGTPAISAEAVHTHAIALNAGISGVGSPHTHAFTGAVPTGALNLAAPAFSGAGLSAVGQVVTAAGVHTMALNECAGMWLIPATGATPAVLILSNTAVTSAAASLTVQGAAPTEAATAGTWRIVRIVTPAGTIAAEAAHTHGPGTLGQPVSGMGSPHAHVVAATVAIEVPALTNLLALTAVEFVAVGRI